MHGLSVEEAYTPIVTPADPGQFLRALRTPQASLREPMAR